MCINVADGITLLSNHQSAPVHSHFALIPTARRGLIEKIK